MKNNLFTSIHLVFLLSLMNLMGQSQTNTLLIGSTKNGPGNIINAENASRVVIANLPASSIISDLKLEYSAYYGKYFLTAKVIGNGISCVGIQLGQSDDMLFAAAGPGVVMTCTGFGCNNCQLALTNGHPFCRCLDPNPETGGRCDMSSRLTISL